MSVATVKMLTDIRHSMGFYHGGADAAAYAKKLLDEKAYVIYGTLGVPLIDGEAAAEEVFDLTNNPDRDEERTNIFGHGRSVSVGDIINVDGVDYLCASVGWIKL